MLKIIPEVNKITFDNTKLCKFYSKIKYINNGDLCVGDFDFFIAKLNFLTDENIVPLNFYIDKKLQNEQYSLRVKQDGIYIAGGSNAGLFYALQTLKQVVVQTKGILPMLEIEDCPRFGYRGFMLDVGRYFYSLQDIKKYIDLIAMHKINVFHWHLTEDQGWRVEIKKYPLLTTIGSKRSHTNFGIKSHKGYYTQKELREIVDYCHSRYIKVIPEFDVPGHMVSAIASYPHLGCFDRKIKVATHWGVKHDIVCAGKESTYNFIYDVLDEMSEIFTDGYFHLGGDEAVKTRWKICPHCQNAIKQYGLENEDDLQQVFMSKVSNYLKTKNIKSIMWNWDSVDHAKYLDKDIIWQLCGSPDKIIMQELNSGRVFFNSNSFPYYLDLPYGWNDLKKTYEYEPCIKGIDNKYADNMLGVEAPLWTEYVPNIKKADFCTFPKLAGFVESAWSDKPKNYDEFLAKICDYYKLLDIYNVRYATLKQANPSSLRAKIQSLWFNKRIFHWQGLHNLIENYLVEKKYGKKVKNKK